MYGDPLKQQVIILFDEIDPNFFIELGALDVFVSTVEQKLITITNSQLIPTVKLISNALQKIQKFALQLSQQPEVLESSARNFAFR